MSEKSGSRSITISLGQMAVHAGEPDRNLNCVRDWTAQAARRGSDLVVFPELWDTGYALDRASTLGTTRGGGRFAQVAALARQHGVHILGSMLETAPAVIGNEAYNTLVWFGPDGTERGVYRKTHLFGLMDEPSYLTPGADPLTIEAPWGRTAAAICYDLRFPELFRGYALAGAEMVVIPAQWPHPRMAHWQTLLRARAIENQMIVVGCNRVGADGGTHFGGRSAVLDAWGEPLVEGGEREALLTVRVDLAQVAQVRAKMPVFDDRRPDVYQL